MLSDALGNPMKFILTGGEKSDFLQACPLLAGQKAGAVLADKGYDASYIVDAIVAMGATVVIPPKSNRSISRDCDAFLYRERNAIERMFCKMKQFRGIATRYSKTALSFMGFVQLAAILLWLK
jgi:transposase